MKTKSIITPLTLSLAVLCGCASQSTKFSSKNGESSYSSDNGTLLENVTGYEDTMTTADGTSHSTKVQNLAGDVQMMQEIRGMFTDLTRLVLLANGNTNVLSFTPTTNALKTSFSPRRIQRKPIPQL